ncbi:MAG: lysine transporter LysE, partial [Prevotella sp.]|nr:lysine transporter LysE [Prevotella sp.]
QFSFIIPDHPLEMSLGYLCIVLGALMWWYGLSWLIDTVRGKFDNNGIILINKTIGGLVVAFSVIILIGTIFNLFTIG